MGYLSVAVAVVLPLLWLPNSVLGNETRAISRHQRLIDRYCVTCHNEKRNTGGLNLEAHPIQNAVSDAEIWERVVHKVRSGEMPPA